MQLTRLEIRGFKSFGDKVVLNFDEGITGVVGPNGCGKSNIVDSIRWVLGEQKTRALRSEKMENIIFNGTKKRKALQMAEVSLTFKNTKNLLPTEYSEVTITRRYYRSGDSEYLLNGVTCRLKDINNLFLDTGIGPNSYAIIELKMVDDILNDQNNSRRGLFEEAAGISKFKIRKKQTLKKLDDTDKDLERVEDLLFEIDKNLKSLERQAKQAEKYMKLKDEYKVTSIQLAKVSLNKQRESYNNIQKQITSENDLKEELNKQLKQKEADLEQQKVDLINKEKLLASRQKALNEHVNSLRQYESDKRIRNERLRFLNDKIADLQAQINNDKLSNERYLQDIKTLQDEVDSATKIHAELEKKTQELKADHEEQKTKTISLQEELNVHNNQLRQKQEEVFQLKKSLEISEVQVETLKNDFQKTSSDDTSHSESITEFQEQMNTLAKDLDAKTKELDKLQEQEAYLNEQITKTENEIEKTRDKLSALNRELDSKQNEYNLTKSMVENLEGFPDAIKFLKKNSHWGKDAPLLSDVLTTDETYRIAIESYLEPLMNYYVVEEVAHAYQAVNMLSDSAKGKANFFVLKSFENFKPHKKKEFDSCVAATDIIEYDNKYEKLISYILNGVYIQTTNSEELPEDPDSIFITQNGKLTKKQFSVSGGSVGLFEGKRIGRAKNLEKLEKKIKDLSNKRDAIKTELDKKTTYLHSLKENTHKQSIEQARNELNELNEQYISIKIKKEQYTDLISNNKTKKEDIQNNIRILEEGIQKSKPKLDLEQVELSNLEEKITQMRTELEYQNEVLSQKSSAYNQENIHLHQQQNKINSIQQEIEYKQTNLDNSKHRIEKNQEELTKTNSEITQLVATTESNDDELVEQYKEKENIEQGVNEAEKKYYESRGQIDETENEIREIQRKRENTDGLLMDLQTTFNEAKLQLSGIRERLKVEFNVDIDQLLIEQKKEEGEEEEPEEIKSESELKQKVERCKEKLERIGPINPMAMEAYEEIKQRHDFITEQREDLFKAKDSLLATITEIDEVAKESFLESFDKIKTNFLEVFRSLFTDEDTCDLKLTDPDNPLESPIEIMAKPKGKRPLTINQLSGGEKTLTAVALLFAIYLLKPAPFCIFDEVDAPLDDANIDKFNNIIKTFSADSQFIIVTHNKRTMASTDVIYGVTMQEQGVSKLVPVDLRELQDS